MGCMDTVNVAVLLLENFITLSATFIVLGWMHFPLDLFHYSYQLLYHILLSITKKYLYIIYFICLFLTSKVQDTYIM